MSGLPGWSYGWGPQDDAASDASHSRQSRRACALSAPSSDSGINFLDNLLAFHEIIRMNDPDRVFAPGGAIEAVLAARDAGKIRYIGFTGHKSPDIHLKMPRHRRIASVPVRHGADTAERHRRPL